MRIAIPLMEEEGRKSRIHPHFGHIQTIAVYDSNAKKLEMVKVKPIQGCSPIEAIRELKIDAIYTFGMGMRAMEICKSLGIELKTGSFQTVGEVIENIGSLQDLRESCGH